VGRKLDVHSRELDEFMYRENRLPDDVRDAREQIVVAPRLTRRSLPPFEPFDSRGEDRDLGGQLSDVRVHMGFALPTSGAIPAPV